MKISVDIECTPQEARTFLGLPDVEPMNQLIMMEVMKRAKNNMDTLADPEKFVAEMMSMGGKGIEGFQALMGAALGGMGSSSGTKKK